MVQGAETHRQVREPAAASLLPFSVPAESSTRVIPASQGAAPNLRNALGLAVLW